MKEKNDFLYSLRKT